MSWKRRENARLENENSARVVGTMREASNDDDDDDDDNDDDNADDNIACAAIVIPMIIAIIAIIRRNSIVIPRQAQISSVIVNVKRKKERCRVATFDKVWII